MQQLCCTQIKCSSYVHNCSFENLPTKLFGWYLPESWLSLAVWEEKSQSGDNAVVCRSLYAANLNSVRPQRSPWGWPLDHAVINVESSLFLAGGGRWFGFPPALLQQLLLAADLGWSDGPKADLTRTPSSSPLNTGTLVLSHVDPRQ